MAPRGRRALAVHRGRTLPAVGSVFLCPGVPLRSPWGVRGARDHQGAARGHQETRGRLQEAALLHQASPGSASLLLPLTTNSVSCPCAVQNSTVLYCTMCCSWADLCISPGRVNVFFCVPSALGKAQKAYSSAVLAWLAKTYAFPASFPRPPPAPQGSTSLPGPPRRRSRPPPSSRWW